MAISHKDHNHPNTPAARAACRKQLERGTGPLSVLAVDECPGTPHRKHTKSQDPCPAKIGRVITAEDEARLADRLVDGVHPGRARKSAQMTVVPRKRGDGGVVQGMKDAKPLKRSGTFLRADHDLADVPRMLAYGVRLAWAVDWDVKIGDRFNENEARIEIHGDLAIISLVWRDKRPDGIWAIWVRNHDSSKQFKVESVQEAISVSQFDSQDAWDEYGNLRNA